MTRAFLGIDLGTSGVKVVALDERGRTVGTASRPYPIRHPFPGAAEANPADWWQATGAAVREIARSGDLEVAAIGVDGQMHGLVLADEHGAAVRPAITWADTRAEREADRWRSLPGPALARLANPITPGMTGPLLAWLVEHEPAHVARAAAALLPKDWLRRQFTGRVLTEPSDASATLLWDVVADTWADAALAALDLPARLLPAVVPSAAPAGKLTPVAAAHLGIPEAAGVPVAAGAADTAAALYATGIQPGQTLLTIGTGGQLTQLVNQPRPATEPVVHLYRAAEPGRWYAMAAIQNAGLALDWVRELLCGSWDELYAAAGRPPTPDLPIFLPFLTGERTPLLDSRVRGCFAGLDARHGRADVFQAATVGVCCALRHALAHLPDPSPPQVLVAGGGTQHPALRQLLADILGVAVAPTRTANASPTGAALLAAAAAGAPLPRRPAELDPAIDPTRHTAHYDEIFTRYISAAASARQLAASAEQPEADPPPSRPSPDSPTRATR